MSYYSLMFFIAYTFKVQVHVFAGQVKIGTCLSCRTSAILKYFCSASVSTFCAKIKHIRNIEVIAAKVYT